MLYELLTGEVPFAGENFVSVALKHVNEPIPRVIDRRHDVPLRVSNAVERAMAKHPDDRFPSMEAFVAELEACFATLGQDADTDATSIMPALPVPAPERRARAAQPRPRRRRLRLALLILGAVLLVLLGLAVLAAALDDGGDGAAQDLRPVAVQGVGAYDPEGTGGEHDAEAVNATDGDRATYWPTETYRSFAKSGVGMVVDAGTRRSLARMTVFTDTPGLRAEIRSGDAPEGPFERRISPSRVANGVTNYPLDGPPAQYYVVWITELPEGNVAHLNEVTARG